MTKKTAKNQKMGKKSNNKTQGKAARNNSLAMFRGLDGPALRWARLLADPCGGVLTSPCYPSGGSGMFVRLHAFVTCQTSALNTCFQFAFSPGTATYTFGETATGAATGTTSASTAAFGATLSGYDAFRPVAACVRVVYLGAEGSRSGMLGTAISQSPLIGPVEAGVSSNALMPLMQRVHRLGEVVHETKWIPSQADGDFGFANNLGAEQRGTIQFVATSIPVQATAMEITGVYEVIPMKNSGLMSSQVPPASANTVGDVLRSLGDATKWAFSNVVAPVVKASAGMAMQTATYAPQLMASSSRALMLM